MFLHATRKNPIIGEHGCFPEKVRAAKGSDKLIFESVLGQRGAAKDAATPPVVLEGVKKTANVTDRPTARSHALQTRNEVCDGWLTAVHAGKNRFSPPKKKLEVAPPIDQRLQVKQDAEQNFGTRSQDIDSSHSYPPGVIGEHSFPALVQKMNAFQNLSVLHFIDRLKVEDESSTVKAAEQANPLQEACFRATCDAEIQRSRSRDSGSSPDRARGPRRPTRRTDKRH